MPTQRIHNLDSQKLQNIVSAALEEFTASSYGTASFNRIIKNSGLSKGSMYYYFESKEDLFLALVNRSFDKLQPLIKALPVFENPDLFWQEAHRLLTQLFAFFSRQPKLGRFVQNVTGESQRGKDTPAETLLGRIDEWLRDFLVTGQVIGAVRRDLPLDLLAELCWSLWLTVGRSIAEHQAGPEVDAASRAAALCDFYMRNLEP